MAAPNIEKVLVLSTAHIPAEVALRQDVLWKDAPEAPRTCGHEHGWIVFLVIADDRPVPEWFRPIRDIAVAADCSLVDFDSTGQLLDGVPTYDW